MSLIAFPGEAHFAGPGDCYRLTLTRDLVGPLCSTGQPRVLFVMLNPSTATATEDDPTIRRCIGFARREGGAALVVCNLFALRSTDPRALYEHEAPEGDPANIQTIEHEASRAALVVAAWGVHGALRGRGARIAELLREHGPRGRVVCLGRTKEGHPKHLLYIRTDAPLEPLA